MYRSVITTTDIVCQVVANYRNVKLDNINALFWIINADQFWPQASCIHVPIRYYLN